MAAANMAATAVGVDRPELNYYNSIAAQRDARHVLDVCEAAPPLSSLLLLQGAKLSLGRRKRRQSLSLARSGEGQAQGNMKTHRCIRVAAIRCKFFAWVIKFCHKL